MDGPKSTNNFLRLILIRSSAISSPKSMKDKYDSLNRRHRHEGHVAKRKVENSLFSQSYGIFSTIFAVNPSPAPSGKIPENGLVLRQ